MLFFGCDVVGMVQIGIGKIVVFVLFVFECFDVLQKILQVFVFVLICEFVLQVCEVFEFYVLKMKGVYVFFVYGGQGYGVQLFVLCCGVYVIVGILGWIMDYFVKGILDFLQLQYFVFDEVDEMLKMGFVEDVEQIFVQMFEEKQVVLFLVMMLLQICCFVQKYLCELEEISIKLKIVMGMNIIQWYFVVLYVQKVDVFICIFEVENFDGMIVFVCMKNEIEMLVEKLCVCGYFVVVINGDVFQVQCECSVNQFKDGKFDIFVVIDVVVCGLDVECISYVVNFDIFIDIELYVYCIGCIGCVGCFGDVISFIMLCECYLFKYIEKVMCQQFMQMQLLSMEDVNIMCLNCFDDVIMMVLFEMICIEVFCDIVVYYVCYYDVFEVDVVVVFVVVVQGDIFLLFDLVNDLFFKVVEVDNCLLCECVIWELWEFCIECWGCGDYVVYCIEVGCWYWVEFCQIVGVFVNEGGFGCDDFGVINICFDFLIVEFFVNFDFVVFEKLWDI